MRASSLSLTSFLIPLIPLFGISACSGDDGGRGDGLDSSTGIGSLGSSDDVETTTESTGSSTGATKLDMGGGETMGTGGDGAMDKGCEEVDLLFVIDNSGSMADEQVNLVSSFPGFITAIQDQLADTEGYHIGVITSDLYAYNNGCQVEGAMVISTGGTDSSYGICGPYAEGHNYMTEMDNLTSTFSCAAQVGTAGDGNERPMQTMLAALAPGMSAPGGCNEGFLRDDALLVIVIITDEEDDHEVDGCLQLPQPGSSGEPPAWYAGVIAAKGGIETNVVVLSLVGPPGPNPAVCPALDKCAGGIEGAEVASRIVQFTNMFTNGFIGRVCEPSYAGFFSEAVSVIKSACDGFEPIG